MAGPRRGWFPDPGRASSVPDSVKREVAARANVLVEEVFRPTYVKPPPTKREFNYIVDIHTKWRGSFFYYFLAKWASPDPNARSPFFECGFARLAYMAGGGFNVAYMRHTDEWREVFTDLSMDEAFETMREQILFHPPG